MKGNNDSFTFLNKCKIKNNYKLVKKILRSSETMSSTFLSLLI